MTVWIGGQRLLWAYMCATCLWHSCVWAHLACGMQMRVNDYCSCSATCRCVWMITALEVRRAGACESWKCESASMSLLRYIHNKRTSIHQYPGKHTRHIRIKSNLNITTKLNWRFVFVLMTAFATAGIDRIKDGTTRIRFWYVWNKPVSTTKPE